jgi:hypothetical protein
MYFLRLFRIISTFFAGFTTFLGLIIYSFRCVINTDNCVFRAFPDSKTFDITMIARLGILRKLLLTKKLLH